MTEFEKWLESIPMDKRHSLCLTDAYRAGYIQGVEDARAAVHKIFKSHYPIPPEELE